ncbi:MAG: hypothetical protein U1D30_06640 [Planctomycetota bacterium]
MNQSPKSRSIGKVTDETLEGFLQSYDREWLVVGPRSFDAYSLNIPSSAKEVVQAIAAYRASLGRDNPQVVVVSDALPVSEAANCFNYEEITEIDEEELPSFVIQCVRGDDFLYLFATDLDFSNGQEITILKVEETEEQDD